jgi:ATP-dependent Clp protease ATP-binding subunit ClpA
MRLENPLRGPRAIRQLVDGADAHARALGDAQIGAEHMLLSALDLPDGLARHALARAGADPAKAEQAIRRTHAAALESVGLQPIADASLDTDRARPRRTVFGESARHVLRSAAARSKLDHSRAVGLHVLGAVGDLREGTAARALRELGVAPGAIHVAVLEELASIDHAA